MLQWSPWQPRWLPCGAVWRRAKITWQCGACACGTRSLQLSSGGSRLTACLGLPVETRRGPISVCACLPTEAQAFASENLIISSATTKGLLRHLLHVCTPAVRQCKLHLLIFHYLYGKTDGFYLSLTQPSFAARQWYTISNACLLQGGTESGGTALLPCNNPCTA